MQWFNTFQRYRSWFEIGGAALLLSINAMVMSTTHIMDAVRNNETASFNTWEPFVWEFSSLFIWLLLVPLILKFIGSSFCGWHKIWRSVVWFLAFSMLISALHVVGMVMLRKLIYWSQSMHYEFGDIVYGYFYEYRKDLMTLVLLIAIIQAYRFIISRLSGEAKIVRDGEDEGEVSQSNFDRILVKKLGKEFILKISDIEWLEACGNYVNLHVQGRIYPTRNTLTKLLAEIEEKGFCRVHRSFAVNLDFVESIETLPSGSGDVFLNNGKTLNLSRRYHEELKTRLR